MISIEEFKDLLTLELSRGGRCYTISHNIVASEWNENYVNVEFFHKQQEFVLCFGIDRNWKRMDFKRDHGIHSIDDLLKFIQPSIKKEVCCVCGKAFYFPDSLKNVERYAHWRCEDSICFYLLEKGFDFLGKVMDCEGNILSMDYIRADTPKDGTIAEDDLYLYLFRHTHTNEEADRAYEIIKICKTIEIAQIRKEYGFL